MKTPTGRPTVMTEATVQKLEQALRDGFSVDMACHVSGISRSTYYSHLERDPDFSHKIELAQDWVTERAKQVLAQAVEGGDVKVAQWWLERKARAEFAPNPSPNTKPNIDPLQKYDPGWIDRAYKALQAE